ncbi:restriction endonuclease subunit S [Mariniblastus sp.]|nr:restriction endonuclease subunit S [Mariniblastus sp.]
MTTTTFDTIPLSETTKFIVDNRGKTAPTTETGIALIATNCITNDSLYPQFVNVRHVSQETYDTWFRAHPEPGDIILTNKGSKNGAICIVPDPVNFVIAQDMMALRANEQIIDPLYLFAVLRSPMAQWQMKSLDVSGVIPHFKKTDFHKLHLPFPPMGIQRAIGKLYHDFCLKIDLNCRMNETLEGIARALFKSWFVDFDPVIDNALAVGNPIPKELADRAEVRSAALADGTANREAAKPFPAAFQQTEELGWIPEGWVGGSIKNLVEQRREKAKNNEVLVLSAIASGDLVASAEHFTKQVYSKTTEKYLLVRQWDFAYNPSRINIGSIGMLELPVLGAVSPVYVVASPDYEYRWFLSFYIRSPLFAEWVNMLASGSVRQSLSFLDFASIPCVIPSRHSLIQFNEEFESIRHSMLANKNASQTLVDLRDTLLPKLISGKLQIADAKKLAEAALA